MIQDWLVEAFRTFTSIDPSSPEGQSLLGQHIFSQSAPDTRRKLQKLQYGPQTPKSRLLDMAFGVFHNQDQAEEDKKTQHDTRQDRQQVQMVVVVVSSALQPQGYQTEIKGRSQQP